MDDINQISLQPLLQPFESNNGAGLLLLSTADDDGDIRIIETLNDYNYADNKNHQQRAVASTGGKALSKKNAKGKGGSNKKTRKKGQQQEQQRRAYDGCRVLRHAGASTLSSEEKKEQVALVTSAVFRPPPPSQTKGGHNRYYEIASGGTDCAVHLWDATRPKQPCSSYQVEQSLNEGGGGQVCNPPMVQGLSWSKSGRILATGLGDGTILLLRVNRHRNLIASGRLGCNDNARNGHTNGHNSCAVGCVHFPQFFASTLDESSISSCYGDRLLVTGGNDGMILLWDLGKNAIEGVEANGNDFCEESMLDPRSLFQNESDNDDNSIEENDNNAEITNNIDKSIEAETARVSLFDEEIKSMPNSPLNIDMLPQPSVIYSINHEKKPNWLCTSTFFRSTATGGSGTMKIINKSKDCSLYDNSRIIPPTLFVADTSNNITLYNLSI
eukprot:CAMPEP_0171294300 /NCGR_PEP_ID=MMETSP0816-20121228/2746_1 /TAXON_ID=420281 /ORGANISM="Proboscia inermis, Strain CCAP1064/1" /LENGTH=441 /DNA_ID=CAMNT_0011765991 /DNA_START=413 /DNA_END=1738 /DNA_ORIENTATION=-